MNSYTQERENVKCVECRNCIGTETDFDKIYYVCNIDGLDYVEECIANDDNLGCDLFVPDYDDDFTA